MIRKVNPSTDRSQIAEIYNEYVEHTTVSFETEPLTASAMGTRIESIAHDFPYYVYTINGKVIGYAYAHKWRARAAYSNTLETTVYIDNSCRHHGIGRKLMQQIIDECRESGYGVLIACITAENTDSIEFHKKLGFTEASHFHNVGEKFGRTLDIIDMELQLRK